MFFSVSHNIIYKYSPQDCVCIDHSQQVFYLVYLFWPGKDKTNKYVFPEQTCWQVSRIFKLMEDK